MKRRSLLVSGLLALTTLAVPRVTQAVEFPGRDHARERGSNRPVLDAEQRREIEDAPHWHPRRVGAEQDRQDDRPGRQRRQARRDTDLVRHDQRV